MRLFIRSVGALVAAALFLAVMPAVASTASRPLAPLSAGGEKPVFPPEGDPGLTPEEWQRQIDQQPLFELRTKVARISAGAAGNPVAGTVFDVPHRTLVVYWHGPVPTALTALGSSAAADGYHLEIRSAAHSAAELSAAAMELAKLAGSPGGLSVEMSYDGSGLVVSYPGLEGVAGFPSAPEVQSAMARITSRGIPVRTESAGGALPTFASRDDDSSPYWGGRSHQ